MTTTYMSPRTSARDFSILSSIAPIATPRYAAMAMPFTVADSRKALRGLHWRVSGAQRHRGFARSQQSQHDFQTGTPLPDVGGVVPCK